MHSNCRLTTVKVDLLTKMVRQVHFSNELYDEDEFIKGLDDIIEEMELEMTAYYHKTKVNKYNSSRLSIIQDISEIFVEDLSKPPKKSSRISERKKELNAEFNGFLANIGLLDVLEYVYSVELEKERNKLIKTQKKAAKVSNNMN